MTQIHISIKKPRTGGLDPVTGTMRFRPVRRHFDAEKNLVIAASFDADLSESGELTVDLLPTTSAFVWQVIELADTPQAYTRYVEVPNSTHVVAYADLVEVDAGTFVPKDMAGSQLLKVRHASTQSEAETLSAQYPDELVFYPEGRAQTVASQILEDLTDARAVVEAQSAVAAQAANAAQAATAQVTAVADSITESKTAVESHASEAMTAIDEAVKSVQDKASDVTVEDNAETTAESTPDTTDAAADGSQEG
ncbi:hypothetical protein [Bifidobacterium longum]|uniref:Uncharacterized protein n=1 Tax=Bifidobacterium longum subsp. longum TaxID=1679 RepID=A0A9Q8QSW6_BIFLL|nr:hypothetical protein [Bifidobacterium longum]UNL65476.1 hypothetical protein G8B15_05885 [Bifidobacterium longum subsp. longum]UNL67439.1 hypothetical protein G8B14_05635 [Bifidobacterium longum subsp. longum]UNL69286.1 hypothetical protein G8B13_04705 [Bifidobacterium longum subsp. longum]UNL70720.1 hypothetical protein G8B12_01410 [Bifidobacterium longum subsp. longum]UNL81791.1 hypothetical protein G8B11_05380 [Bifidobacterium longum subsp. longum]